jgi:hypothetical protein
VGVLVAGAVELLVVLLSIVKELDSVEDDDDTSEDDDGDI